MAARVITLSKHQSVELKGPSGEVLIVRRDDMPDNTPKRRKTRKQRIAARNMREQRQRTEKEARRLLSRYERGLRSRYAR